jgi:hypothetical protein
MKTATLRRPLPKGKEVREPDRTAEPAAAKVGGRPGVNRHE